MPIIATQQAERGEIPEQWRQDMALARRYAGPGPRYTSYPTAPQMSSEFDVGEYLDFLAQAPASREPLSLYVHLPFCRDICYYCACNKTVTRKPGTAERYLDLLEREIDRQSELIGHSRPVTQLHWGGGTPTYLDPAEMTRLMHLLASRFQLLDGADREYSIEIDPRTVTTDTLALLRGLGFNRLSLGIQDFDPDVQKAINRRQTPGEVRVLVDAARAYGFKSISFDLIYGLPLQTERSVSGTIDAVLEMRPDRIACYNYAHLPERFSSQRAIDRLALPSPEQKLLQQQIVAHRLAEAGYAFIGMDHFVLPDDELATAQQAGKLQRNFQGYSLRLADDLLGLGVSAISQVGDFIVQNARKLEDYGAMVRNHGLPIHAGYRISEEDRLRRHIIMSLICTLHLDIAATNREYGIDLHRDFARELDALEPLAADGLLSIGRDSLTVTAVGRPFLRNICMPFDAYLAPASETAGPRFSATI